ncbi:MAG TPA: hypothetical protein VKL40_01375 [Candidatus Angelobacter sp.]|nr:hypothetical protein [Candidatus Angelobacter sp.]
MKSHIRTKGPIFSMRLRGPHAVGRVLEGIKHITGELEDLQAEIYSRMGGPGEMLQSLSPREREAAERTLSDFKLALDQLRYVLWLSLEPRARQTRQARTNELPVPAEDSKPQHTSSGKVVAPRVESSAEPTSASFFDRLDVVIEAYMSKNKPPDSASRKRGKP